MRISDWSSDVCSSDLLDLDRTFLLRALPRDDDRFAFVGRRQILGENRRGCEQCKSADTGEAKLVSHMSSPDCCGAPRAGQRQFCDQSVTAMLRDRKRGVSGTRV